MAFSLLALLLLLMWLVAVCVDVAVMVCFVLLVVLSLLSVRCMQPLYMCMIKYKDVCVVHVDVVVDDGDVAGVAGGVVVVIAAYIGVGDAVSSIVACWCRCIVCLWCCCC